MAQSPACRMDTSKHQLLRLQKLQTPQGEPGDICTLATQRTFLTQEEMFLAQTGLCCLLLPKKREFTLQSIWHHSKWCSTSQISLQIKTRAKINIGMRLNMNLRRRMTWTVCHATRHGNENSSMMLKKKVLINNT